MTLQETRARLCAVWNAGLVYHDLLQSLTFRADGTGEFVYGYGQAIREIITFRYHLVDEQHLQFELTPSDGAISSNTTAFSLQQGVWTFSTSSLHFDQQLTLHNDPFAAAYESDALEHVYYAPATPAP